MRYHKMKYLKVERGIAYYRRGKYRERLKGNPGTEELFISWSRCHEKYEHKPVSPADTLALPDTFRALSVAYLKSAEFKRSSEGTRRNYRRYTDIACKYFGKYDAEDIQMKHVLAVRDKLENTPAAANDLIKMIRIIYGWGIPRGKVSHNPADFRHTSIKPLPTGEHQPWPEPLIQSFLNNTRPEITWTLATCLYTGQRIGDVLNMGWNDINDDQMNVTQEKTGKKLRIPLHPEFRQLLSIIPKHSIKILTSYTGRVWTYSRWQEAFSEERAIHNAQGYVTHGLRKNAVIRLLYAGCTTEQVGSITGQSNRMVDYYARQIDQERLAKVAMDKYAEWTKTERKSGEVVKW